MSSNMAYSQPEGYNYDESKVPTYELPPLFEGSTPPSAEAWVKRRTGLINLFSNQVFGRTPSAGKDTLWWEIRQEIPDALGGIAEMREVRLHFSKESGGPFADLLLILPATRSGAVPVFLGLNFFGNHTIHPEKAITIPGSWMYNYKQAGVVDHQATEAGRGANAQRWPLEMILERGYGVATMYYGDLDPDFHDGYKNGIHPLFERSGDGSDWGAIGAWAWGLSRALDYLQQSPEVRGDQVAVFGHSRLGKAALWAGVQDERFAMVISNDSGCGGAAISRRRFGETVARINNSFPHWFCDNFKQYNDQEDDLPVDQHQLLAMVAPRPLYVASASEDLWADPRGEFLSAQQASQVYEWLGKPGLSTKTFPEPGPNSDNQGFVAYHLRPGEHEILAFDWTAYLNFADQHFTH